MRRAGRILLGFAAAFVALGAGFSIFVLANRYEPPQNSERTDYVEPPPVADDLSWASYGGDPGQTRYSRIDQIMPENVAHLRRAWVYRTGELERRGHLAKQGKFQATPLLAAGNLVFCTPFSRVIALDPATGTERWVYDPELKIPRGIPGEKFNCRGLALWRDSAMPAGSICGERLFLATTDRRLIALDARSGAPCPDFGTNGQVTVVLERPELRETELQFTSAPAVVGDVVVVGSASGDNNRAFGPSGTVRAFDARNGTLRWTFDPVPRSYDPVASPTWEEGSAARTGQANVWGSITVDLERNMVFLPTSSPSPDFYGGLRKGDNLYANSIVALEGDTGEVVWHFQTVHHDLWDYDIPAGPTLITYRKDGRAIPALVFATKTGFLFILNRETGEPLTSVEERPVPQSDVPGERTSPTQPFSTGLPVLSAQKVDADDPFGVAIFDRMACREAMASARNEGIFTPPSTRGTLIVPMSGGGANWGGVAIDPETNRLFVNTNNAVNKVTLLSPEEARRRKPRERDKEISLMDGAPYGMIREVLLSPIGMPCNKPPWGTLAAVDLDTGELAWQVPLGTTRKVAPLGLAFRWGMPNFGAPIVTDGGVVFIGAAIDDLLRAFDPETGEELWAGELPAAGTATPMTYAIGGKQYVVIAAGGHPTLGTEIGDYLIAFSLPD